MSFRRSPSPSAFSSPSWIGLVALIVVLSAITGLSAAVPPSLERPGALSSNLVEFPFPLKRDSLSGGELSAVNVILAATPDGDVYFNSPPSSFDEFAYPSTHQIFRIKPNGAVDPGFNAKLALENGTIAVMAKRPNGKLLLGGNLVMSTDGHTAAALVQLNPDGTLDPTWTSPFSPGTIVEAIHAADSVLIGGAFSFAGTDDSRHLARLTESGGIDSTFEPRFAGILEFSGAESGFTVISAVAVETGGRTLVGGNFTSVNDHPQSALARLLPDGTLDRSFKPRIDGPVREIIALPSGKIWVRGDFRSVNGRPRFQLDRLNADGSSDADFRPPAKFYGGNIMAMSVQSDGKLLIGAISAAGVGGTLMPGLFRINFGGSLDATFQSELRGVAGLALQGSSLLAFHAAFCCESSMISRVHLETTNGPPVVQFAAAVQTVAESQNHAVIVVERWGDPRPLTVNYSTADGTAIARADYLPTSGTLVFGHGENKKTFNVPVLADPIGEDHETVELTLKSMETGVSLANGGKATLKIVNDDSGAVDRTYSPPASCGPQAFLVQPDGKVVVAGSFVFEETWRGLARLNRDGSLDRTFAADTDRRFNAAPCRYQLLAQPDGKFLAASSCGPLLRFDADGNSDPEFAPTGPASAVALQPDGKILVGNIDCCDSGEPALVRLNPDGSNDPTFNVQLGPFPFAIEIVTALAVLDNGQILVSGNFQSVNGLPIANFARLNPDGSVDRSVEFDLLPANAIVRKPDGKWLAAGKAYAPSDYRHLPGIAQLTPEGAVDGSFDPGTGVGGGFPRFGPAEILSVAVQLDGKILVAGAFTEFNGRPIQNVARLNVDGSLDETFIPAARLDNDGSVDPIYIPPSVPPFQAPSQRFIYAIATESSGNVLIAGPGIWARLAGDPVPRTQITIQSTRIDRSLTLRYVRPAGNTPANQQIEISTDLKSWTLQPARVEEVSITANPDGVTEVVQLRVTTALASGPHLFFRVRLDSLMP